ncbi:MAG TPA: hypothetical protein VFS05_11030 [Gemmatimonadaceae bacterium]|nr:hypothetical protein [Gemmatimonadaceae bacterium]
MVYLARDGKRIFYRQGRRLIAADVRAGQTISVSSRTTLFEGDFLPAVAPHANYDVMPDGRELIMLKPSSDATAMVVYDWRAELRARMANAGLR